MFLCSFIQEYCAKLENIKTDCALTFGGQWIKNVWYFDFHSNKLTVIDKYYQMSYGLKINELYTYHKINLTK